MIWVVFNLCNGLLLYNKEAGQTSYRSLTPIKQALGIKKVGHTGTLDSFAEGLMLVLVGPSVTLCSAFQNMDKEYQAGVRFGEETDTLDPQGEIVARSDIPRLEDIQAVLPEFTGLIKQRPPEYAAVHVDGKRAWQRKLDGEHFELPERDVRVDSITITSFEDGLLQCTCRVSSGTYIRSLWRDIARRCNSTAHLRSLYRTSVGVFHCAQAQSATIIRDDIIIPPKDFIAKIPGLHICYANREGEKRFYEGNEIKVHHLMHFDAERQNICCNTEGKVLAKVSMHNRAIRYRCL